LEYIKLEDKNIHGIVFNQEGKKLMDRSKSLLSDIIQQKQIKESKSKRRNYQKEYMKQYRSKK
jgi:NifU-like protein involved in Fe-S cluster formation